MRYAVEEHCAGQLMGELAGASACCLTSSTGPTGSARPPRRHHRVDILLGRHLVTAGDDPPHRYARSARLATLALALPATDGILVTARWQTHGRPESCWLGFGDGPDGRTFLLLLQAAVERATQPRPLSTQNSLPSGSASTIQVTSPWSMSTRRAPMSTSRSTSAA